MRTTTSTEPVTSPLREILGSRSGGLERANTAVRAVYQPVVDIATGQVVAYESLARGPVGSPLESPMALFGAAAEEGLVAELDRACRRAAIEGAAGLMSPDQALFVNVEPAALHAGIAADDPLLSAARPRQVVVEVTERMLCARPAELLAFVAAAREHGLGIALDDVGALDESLALMPFLRPDIIKLDLRLVQERPARDHGRIVAAVLAQAEATGARILAEGIETPAHIERAIGLGATLVQGYYFGRPGPDVDAPSPPPAIAVRTTPTVMDPSAPTSPFDVVAAVRETRLARRGQLLSLSQHLESIPLTSELPDVVVSTFQEARRFTPATARRYAQLVERCSLVAALGMDLPAEPAPGVRGAAIAPDDHLRDEWSVIVVGPHYAAALVARQLPGQDDDDDAQFSFVVTHDRALVLAAASTLLRRVVAS